MSSSSSGALGRFLMSKHTNNCSCSGYKEAQVFSAFHYQYSETFVFWRITVTKTSLATADYTIATTRSLHKERAMQQQHRNIITPLLPLQTLTMYTERQKTSSTCGYNNVQLASYFTLSYSNQSPENTEKKLSLTKQYAVVTRKTRHTIAKRSFLVYHNSTIHTEDKTPSLLLLSIARAEKREHHVGV